MHFVTSARIFCQRISLFMFCNFFSPLCPVICMRQKAVSLNIRGLNKSIKRGKLFRWLHVKRFDIIFLHETYSDPSLEDVWRAEWGGEILFAHGFKHSKGVMILFKPSLKVDILEITVDKNGRFIVANININEDDLCLVMLPMNKTSKLTFLTKSSIPFAVVVLTLFY